MITGIVKLPGAGERELRHFPGGGDATGQEAELDSMAEFYGPPPPAWIAFDMDAGTRTEIFDETALFGRQIPA